MTAVRIQRRRAAGWRMPAGAVYVGRPTRWGNPWSIGRCRRVDCGPTSGWCIAGPDERHSRAGNLGDGRRSVVASFGEANSHPDRTAEIRAALRGRDLACWCPLDQPCHADVLLAIANDGSAAVTRLEVAEARLEAVLRQHWRTSTVWGGVSRAACGRCAYGDGVPYLWPCPTRQAVTGEPAPDPRRPDSLSA